MKWLHVALSAMLQLTKVVISQRLDLMISEGFPNCFLASAAAFLLTFPMLLPRIPASKPCSQHLHLQEQLTQTIKQILVKAGQVSLLIQRPQLQKFPKSWSNISLKCDEWAYLWLWKSAMKNSSPKTQSWEIWKGEPPPSFAPCKTQKLETRDTESPHGHRHGAALTLQQ